MKVIRNRILAVVIIVAVILIIVRIRLITNVPMETEAAETRLQLEALAEQDTEPIQEEIDLKRSVVDAETDMEQDDSGSDEEADYVAE